MPSQPVGHRDVQIRQAAGRVPITALHDTRTFVTHPFPCPAFGFARAFGKQVRVHVVYGIERAIGLHAFAVTGPRRIGEPDEIAHATAGQFIQEILVAFADRVAGHDRHATGQLRQRRRGRRVNGGTVVRHCLLRSFAGEHKSIGDVGIAVGVHIIGPGFIVEVEAARRRISANHLRDAVLHREAPVPETIVVVFQLERFDRWFEHEQFGDKHSLRRNTRAVMIANAEAVQMQALAVVRINGESRRLVVFFHPHPHDDTNWRRQTRVFQQMSDPDGILFHCRADGFGKVTATLAVEFNVKPIE